MEKKVNLIVFHTFVEQKPPNTLTESIEFITCKPASCHHLVCKSQNRFQDVGQLLYHVSWSGPWTAPRRKSALKKQKLQHWKAAGACCVSVCVCLHASLLARRILL